MKTKLPTSKRQLKKLHKKLESGELAVVLQRHTAANNLKAIAKVNKLIAHAEEYDRVLATEAQHKEALDASRPMRTAKKAVALTKAAGIPKDKYLEAKTKAKAK